MIWRNKLGTHPSLVYEGIGHGSAEDVARSIQRDMEVGQRFEMVFGYTTQKDYGHIVMVEWPSAKNGRKPIVVDPQTGAIMDLAKYLHTHSVDYQTVAVLRVDNLDVELGDIHQVVKPRRQR